MKIHSLADKGILRQIVVCMVTMVLLCTAGVQAASKGASKLLKIDIAADRQWADVNVPVGYGTVVLQKFEYIGGWQKVASKNVRPGIVKFKLPSANKNSRWRAIGRLTGNMGSHKKFPAAFYAGKNEFALQKSASGSLFNFAISKNLASGDIAAPTTDEPVEADIWKTDGNTVYFFNQLRGLQVLDISNPADPRMIASLRMPAVGEDLYLLPSVGRAAYLVLLTQKQFGEESMTRINLVKVEDGKVEITHRQDVPGQLADSRMIGRRLILATTDLNSNLLDSWATSTNRTSNHLTQWTITPGQAPKDAGQYDIEGNTPIIAAGADWLAVSVYPNDDWTHSAVTVFGLTADGLAQLTPQPIHTAGIIGDKFKMQWFNHVLTTISERNQSEDVWSPTTVLENFRVWGADVILSMTVDSRLGRLELANGESLYATRLAGNKAYIVTFLQTDPLWVIDLTDAKRPVISGQLEVPGWSSHLEPIGDMLFAIGWDSGTISASLFDVSDPTAPVLRRRVALGSPGTYSEAAWDEQALKVLPDAGLALVPVTSYDDSTGQSLATVRLLDIDTEKGDLYLRGAIPHAFDARRADLIGNSVVSISQRVLVTADVSNRDQPAISSEVSLAWPVDRVLDAGSYLIQIEQGSSYGNSRATARVSLANETEAILSETALGDGRVCGADLRDGKLYILRELGVSSPIFYRNSILSGDSSTRLKLDVYDASALPALEITGSVTKKIQSNRRVMGDGLYWPQENRPTVILDAQAVFWYGLLNDTVTIQPLSIKDAWPAPSAKRSIVIDHFPTWRPRHAPRLLVFDVADAANPTVGDTVPVGTAETIPNGIYQAADGLLVMGTANYKDETNGVKFAPGQSQQAVHVAEIGESGDPVVHPAIDLPGELFAVSDMDHNGFLAFTKTSQESDDTTLKVCACDGYDAYEIAQLDAKAAAAATAGGRRLFIAASGGVKRFRLTDEGVFAAETLLDVGWKPDALRWVDGVLLGTKTSSLFAAESKADAAMTWRFPTWSFWIEQAAIAENGDLLLPYGEYGAQRLAR